MTNKYYQIATDGRTAEIVIYGDITSFADNLRRWYGDDDNIAEVSSRQVIREINDLDVDMINVYINSYGGEVAEALAIYSALRRHKASVHTFCDGFACSAATIVFCAGDERTIGRLALLMVHNCMVNPGYANAEELRKAADDADKINQSSIKAYLAVTNLTEEEIREMMGHEEWITAEDAVSYGFATDMTDTDEGGHAQQSALRMIRQAVLGGKPRTEYDTILERLAGIERCVEALHAMPEGNSNPERIPVPERTTRERACIFFAHMFKKEG